MANNQEKPKIAPKGLEMYFSKEVVDKFAAHEQNEKNFAVAEIVDKILMQESEKMAAPIFCAELGGGAHPDRYHKFFEKLLGKPKGHIDWVDISPFMLQSAQEYLKDKKYEKRNEVISFIEKDILKYLEDLADEKLDLAIMKYTFEDIEDIELLFKLLAKKIKKGGKLIATIGKPDQKLKSFSTNARYLYNGEEFPDNEERILKDGDNYTVKFLKVSGDPKSGYLEGAETVKYFHSAKKIQNLAKQLGFKTYLGDWKDFVKTENQGQEKMEQGVLILEKE